MHGESNDGYGFAWDSAKAESNLTKHGVSFEEAQSVFDDPLAGVFDDALHSSEEQRFYIIGISSGNRLLAVWYTERDGTIRIISARDATSKERRGYENERNS